MNTKIGILTESIGTNQAEYFLCSELNKLVKSNMDITPYVFYNNYNRIPILIVGMKFN